MKSIAMILALVCLATVKAVAEGDANTSATTTPIESLKAEKPVTIRATSAVLVGSVRSSDISNLPEPGDITDKVTILDTQLSLETKKGFSAYLDIPVAWSTSSDSTFSRAFGRPEIGAFQVVSYSEDFMATIGLSVRLPLYEETDQTITSGNRVWQMAPTALIDKRLGTSRFHLLAMEKFCVDTQARVALPVPDSDGNLLLVSDALERSPALRTSAGIEYEHNKFSASLTARAVQGLGSGKVSNGNTVLREVAPLDLFSVELEGSYELPGETKVTAIFSQGFKIRSDFYTLITLDAPEEIASSTIGLGLTKTF